MALTRKYLKAMGIEDEKIDQIIDAHTETVDGLKADIAKYKTDAEKLNGVQEELDALKAKGDDGYREKYEKEHSDFEAYKSDVAKKETHTAKEKAYRELLRGAGVKDKFIDTVIRAEQSAIDALELTDGKIAEPEKLTAEIKETWADFVAVTQTTAAGAANPPNNNGGSSMTKEQIMAIKDPVERQGKIAENISLFQKG